MVKKHWKIKVKDHEFKGEKLMGINQKFHIKQIHHEITFYAYDIEKIDKITSYVLSRIYVPECLKRDNKTGCNKRNIKEICCTCHIPHLQELLMDGWYVGNKKGFIDEDSYYAELQAGIRVPVDKKIYDAWIQGWEIEPDNGSVYEIRMF